MKWRQLIETGDPDNIQLVWQMAGNSIPMQDFILHGVVPYFQKHKSVSDFIVNRKPMWSLTRTGMYKYIVLESDDESPQLWINVTYEIGEVFKLTVGLGADGAAEDIASIDIPYDKQTSKLRDKMMKEHKLSTSGDLVTAMILLGYDVGRNYRKAGYSNVGAAYEVQQIYDKIYDECIAFVKLGGGKQYVHTLLFNPLFEQALLKEKL